MSPTQRTLAYCRDRGWLPAVVERWNPHARVRHDLYGGIDLVVMDGGPGLLAIQATSGTNLGARVDKLTELDSMREWLRRGLRLEAWGWRQLRSQARNKDGSRSKRKEWHPRRMRAYLEADGSMGWDDVDGEQATKESA